MKSNVEKYIHLLSILEGLIVGDAWITLELAESPGPDDLKKGEGGGGGG